MASNQELELLPEIQEAEFFSSDATISPPPTTTTPSFEVPVGHLERCNSCGSWKKRSTSPLSSLQLQEPAPKRASFIIPGAASSNKNLQLISKGFQEHQLPNPNSSSPLIVPSSVVKHSDLDDGECNGNASGIEEKFQGQCRVSQYPPLPQTLLRRSASDPSGSDFHAEVTTATPPRPPAARNLSRSPSYAPGSADLRRWRRMKRREKEIRQWNEEFAQDEDKDEQTCYGILDTSQNDLSIKHEEAVWAEKKGEDLVLHFKCPCRKEYEIYMFGTKCYYRVI